jgi:hypothetical protein
MILRDLRFVEKRDELSGELYLPLIGGEAWGQPDNPPPTGERVLVMAIIGQAYLDALELDEDALEYFESELYQYHLALLGLGPDWLPEGLGRLDWDHLIAMGSKGEMSHV